MVILNVDHPDVEEFIWCKANEERKARALEAAGFDMSLDGRDITSIQYQNANNSVRVTDEFMQAVVDDADWELREVTTGNVVKTVPARDLMRQISKATWECADPGMQFDTTINRWHTAANTGRINGSNPCSEYMHLDNSACNLASLNLLKFLGDDDTFDVEGFQAAVGCVFTAQEILVGRADYPTEPIAETSRRFRQLGIGYANLGALLMALGLPYDSDEGRAWAAGITALMTGHSYATSARTAARMGPFAGYTDNVEPMLGVLDMHRQAASQIDEELVPSELLSAAQRSWDEACEIAADFGVRNSQASVLAPTGTIGLMMDCDTTGIEPDLGLCKMKKLVGGGNMTIVNQTVPRALRRLGYDAAQIDEIVAYIDENKTILGAPHVDPDHVPVFACSMGDNAIHYSGHVKMMGAVQPFISGAISKTVNMPEEVSVEEVEQLHIDAWRLGIKAVAIYRDNCKVAQPLAMATRDGDTAESGAAVAAAAAADQVVERVVEKIVHQPVRQRLPRTRRSRTFEFRVADCKGFVTVGEYDDGQPGRDLRAGVEAGLDAGRHHGCLRHLGQPRPAVRRAAAQLRGGLHRHALRAGRHDRRSRPAHRQLADGLPLPQAGAAVPVARRAGRAEHLQHRRAHAAHPARRRGHDGRDPPGFRAAGRSPFGGVGLRAGGQPVGHGHGQHGAGQPRRPHVHAVRCPDAAGRLLPRLPQLRHHQRLQLTRSNGWWDSSGDRQSFMSPGHPGPGEHDPVHEVGPTQALRIVPIPSIQLSSTWPGCSARGGLRAMPTPAGVPVKMMSPASSGSTADSSATSRPTPKMRSLVRASCTVSPSTRQPRPRSSGSGTSSMVTIHGPRGP